MGLKMKYIKIISVALAFIFMLSFVSMFADGLGAGATVEESAHITLEYRGGLPDLRYNGLVGDYYDFAYNQNNVNDEEPLLSSNNVRIYNTGLENLDKIKLTYWREESSAYVNDETWNWASDSTPALNGDIYDMIIIEKWSGGSKEWTFNYGGSDGRSFYTLNSALTNTIDEYLVVRTEWVYDQNDVTYPDTLGAGIYENSFRVQLYSSVASAESNILEIEQSLLMAGTELLVSTILSDGTDTFNFGIIGTSDVSIITQNTLTFTVLVNSVDVKTIRVFTTDLDGVSNSLIMKGNSNLILDGTVYPINSAGFVNVSKVYEEGDSGTIRLELEDVQSSDGEITEGDYDGEIAIVFANNPEYMIMLGMASYNDTAEEFEIVEEVYINPYFIAFIAFGSVIAIYVFVIRKD